MFLSNIFCVFIHRKICHSFISSSVHPSIHPSFHPETLEDLETNVLQLFDGVEDKNLEAIEWKEHPYANDQLRVGRQTVTITDRVPSHSGNQGKPSKRVFPVREN